MTIDTLKLSKNLESAGMARAQAEHVAEALDGAVSGNGLAELRREIQALAERLRHLERDMAVLKWMVGFNLAATVALIMLQLR